MALTACRECKKEVSSEAKVCPHCGIDNPAAVIKKASKAVCKKCKKEVLISDKTCPHCGVKNPGITKRAAASGCLVVVIITGLIGMGLKACTSDHGTSKKQETTCSQTDGACLFNRDIGAAIVNCVPAIEKSAKFDFECSRENKIGLTPTHN